MTSADGECLMAFPGQGMQHPLHSRCPVMMRTEGTGIGGGSGALAAPLASRPSLIQDGVGSTWVDR